MRSSAGSVTDYLGQLKNGNSVAIQQLWDRYFERLIRLAHGKLTVAPRMESYDEDVALSAFASFIRAVELERFPDLNDRKDLWQILVMLTHRKAGGLLRRERRTKRGSGRIKNAPDWRKEDGSEAGDLFLKVISREPTPEEAAEVAEECQRQLDLLKDSTLRQVALLKLEGFSNEEIAAQLGCVSRTVERKLDSIRTIWKIENRS